MTIRRLTESDAAAFQAIRLRGLTEEPSAFASSFDEECQTSLTEIERRLQAKSDGVILGAFDNEQLIGVVGVQRETMKKLSHKAFVWGMYVTPSHRRRGVGADLLDCALECAWRELGVLQVNLGVHTQNSAALKVYRLAGFEIFGTEHGALRVNGVPQDEYHMVCRASSAA